MTVSEQKTGTWKPVPGASHYEACDAGGLIRSDWSTPKRTLTPKKTGTSRYWQVKYTDDTGRQRTRPVHVLVLEAHRGLAPPGMEGCHDDDDPDNNDLSNLFWKPAAGPHSNRWDRAENNPPKPKPLRECVRCGDEFAGNGRRCHPCVVEVGKLAAGLLRSGVTLERAAAQLEYPSVDGLHTLARKHGGYGQSWSRRVRARLSAWLADGDAQ